MSARDAAPPATRRRVRVGAAVVAAVAAAVAATLVYRARQMNSPDNALRAVEAVVDVVRRNAGSVPDGLVDVAAPFWSNVSLPHGFTRAARLRSPWGADVQVARAGPLVVVDLHKPPAKMCVPLMTGAAAVPGAVRVSVNTIAADERPVSLPAGVAEQDCRKAVEVIRFLATVAPASAGGNKGPP